MTVPRVLFLDAGNTLVEVDWAPVAAIISRHGGKTTAGELRSRTALLWPRLDRAIAAHARSTESPGVKRFVTTLVLEAAGFPDGAPRAAVEEDLAAALPRLWRSPLPGVFEALDGFRRAGLRLAVVSNSNGTVERGLSECGFDGYFEAVVDSGVVGVEKPDPEIFNIALRRMGARPEEAVHVGDLPSVDVAGARAAGIAPVLLDPYGVFPDCDAPRVASLAELRFADGPPVSR